MAAAQGRSRWLNAGIAPVMFALSPERVENLKSTVRPNGAKAQAFEPCNFIPSAVPITAKNGRFGSRWR
jgi:hypothetical protein